MKQLMMIACISLLSISVVQAKQQGSDKVQQLHTYKCHLVLNDNREVIRDYRRQPKNQNGNLQRMLLNQQVAVEKGARLAIVEVVECVESDADFSKATSRELDRMTLR